MATVTCECNELFHYSDEQAGGTIRCRCGRFVSLPVVAITHHPFASAPATASPQRSASTWLRPVVIVVAGIGAIAMTYWMNTPPSHVQQPVAAYTPRLAPLPPPTLPVVPFPENGATSDYAHRENVAPFEVSASGKSANFVVRLRDAATNALVIDVYVRTGRSAEIRVPLGRYRLLIASGDKWYGLEHLFGNRGAYGEAEKHLDFVQLRDRLRGHTIELQESIQGNLKKRAIARREF